MKVAFCSNNIGYGGVEVALYDYADYNETILGNKSIIITRDFSAERRSIYEKFERRFQVFYIKYTNEIDAIVRRQKVDVFYSIKSGEADTYITRACKCVVHCVFVTTQPHGNVYAAIHQHVNMLNCTNIPVVPHMVRIDNHSDSFRKELGIPPDSVVIGRYGSPSTFDLDFVHHAIVDLLNRNPTMWFVCMATDSFAVHPRIVYLPTTSELYVKRKMINTCDVMLHARTRGETFGLSCGEFSVAGKPFLTWGHSEEMAHVEIARGVCILYSNKQQIIEIIESGQWKNIDMSKSGYLDYTPEKVMAIFKQVFLS